PQAPARRWAREALGWAHGRRPPARAPARSLPHLRSRRARVAPQDRGRLRRRLAALPRLPPPRGRAGGGCDPARARLRPSRRVGGGGALGALAGAAPGGDPDVPPLPPRRPTRDERPGACGRAAEDRPLVAGGARARGDRGAARRPRSRHGGRRARPGDPRAALRHRLARLRALRSHPGRPPPPGGLSGGARQGQQGADRPGGARGHRGGRALPPLRARRDRAGEGGAPPLRRADGPSPQPPDRVEAHPPARASGGDPQGDLAAQAAALLRHAFARGRGGSARRAADARPRRREHHPDLHPRGSPAAARPLRQIPSPRLTRGPPCGRRWAGVIVARMSRTYRLGPAPTPRASLVDFERHLDAEQLAAARAPLGPVLVIAGAGSGKTRTLVFRLVHLLEQGIPPEGILLLTFT